MRLLKKTGKWWFSCRARQMISKSTNSEKKLLILVELPHVAASCYMCLAGKRSLVELFSPIRIKCLLFRIPTCWKLRISEDLLENPDSRGWEVWETGRALNSVLYSPSGFSCPSSLKQLSILAKFSSPSPSPLSDQCTLFTLLFPSLHQNWF